MRVYLFLGPLQAELATAKKTKNAFLICINIIAMSLVWMITISSSVTHHLIWHICANEAASSSTPVWP